MTPFTVEAKESPASSCKGRASRSARNATVLPGPRPWISTVTEVSVGRSGARPKLVSFSTTKSEVACSL